MARLFPRWAHLVAHEMTTSIFAGLAIFSRRGAQTSRLLNVIELRLCELIDNRGLQTFYAVRGELRKAHDLGLQLLDLAQQANSPALTLEAHHVLEDSFLIQADFCRAREHLERALALDDPQHHSEHAFVMGQILRGWALAHQGKEEEGLAQIRQGQAACQAIGIGLGWSGTLFQLAEVCGKTRQFAEGLGVIASALAYAAASNERCFETELLRLKGELLLQLAQAQPESFRS